MIEHKEQTKPLILLVDDDLSILLLAKRALIKAGFELETAGSGHEGLKMLDSISPHIILLDVEMPGMNGFEVCEQIRQHPAGEDVPILMVTGMEDMESINRAYEAGATDFFNKPINWQLLHHRIRYILRNSVTYNQLKVSESSLRNAHRISKLGTWQWDQKSNHIEWSKEVVDLMGWTKDVPASFTDFMSFVHPEDKDYVLRNITNTMQDQTTQYFSIEHRVIRVDGDERYVFQRGEILWNELHKAMWVTAAIQDITDRKEAEKKIHHLAYYDTLTGLPNRLQFKETLTKILALMERNKGKLALLFVDLDNFKRINDTLGHDYGDQLLKAVSERLTAGVRLSDNVAQHQSLPFKEISRLGGDEFTVMLTDINSVDNVTLIAQRILEDVNQPYFLSGYEMYVSPSIGISVFPQDGTNADVLIKNADTAMYHAKNKGRNNFQFYSESMNTRALQRLSLENKLRKALIKKEFEVYYQPLVNIRTRSVMGAEALIRWDHPEAGMISPETFIPVAEDIGAILDIGQWVIEQVCQQIHQWEQLNLKPFYVAVNMSAVQFYQQNLLSSLQNALDKAGISSDALTLELTEGVIMENAKETIAKLQQIKNMGIRLSIDDFGTGYSSLSYLKRFPIDTIKIDRSFITDITSNPDDAAISDTIIAMGHRLGLKVVAEGIETKEQYQYLARQGCDIGQGYLFSKPLSQEEFTRFLQKNIKDCELTCA